ncbi:hypothetical protein K491DRAFT_492808 [Lophiostoma macrostomum CBS 122681]|uniref:Uncharacterized protein n=1 Tax=Lophiostoma macrostomum CBS 122681 TaxID=1314788 RepID=A0A6A6T586_9PLEO|nr:hypothetical protein K491DRAFT_492808 [Lophiostoma macrostomum CBS 122681]
MRGSCRRIWSTWQVPSRLNISVSLVLSTMELHFPPWRRNCSVSEYLTWSIYDVTAFAALTSIQLILNYTCRTSQQVQCLPSYNHDRTTYLHLPSPPKDARRRSDRQGVSFVEQ